MRLLVAVLAVLVGGTVAQSGYYPRAPFRPIAPYYSSNERIVQQGQVSTADYYPAAPSPSSGYSSNPCSPSPCGENTRCEVSARGIAQCHCLHDYVPKGNTINGCKPQCLRHDECPDEYRCQSTKCVRVCGPGACASNAICRARNHAPICTCPPNSRDDSDPYSNCVDDEPESKAQPPAPYIDPCERNPCGTNADCRTRNERPVCSCPLGYEGDPLINCVRGECLENDDCPGHKVCQRLRCVDPCLEARSGGRSMCGHDADCRTKNHQPICSCPQGFVGDPMSRCRRFDPSELCSPSPCGHNTNCKVRNNRAVCSCIQNYIGDPLSGCRPECTSDRDCGHKMACRNSICVNPCAGGACGEGAYCDVKNGRAVCSCPQYFLGDAYSRCYTECVEHDDCPYNRQCNKFKCVDPCAGACGEGANCKVEDRKAICSCPKGHTGHPYERCRPFTDADYCNPNPCGDGARCQVGHDRSGDKRPVCTCDEGDIGNPLISCRAGECRENRECSPLQACYQYQCMNPCYHNGESVCGNGADCYVKDHMPVCSCPPGYQGNPKESCYEDYRQRSSNRYIIGRNK